MILLPIAAARRSRGFTLIELMIVVAVIAVIVAFAYPSYVDHVRKSRRAQAKADMVELAQLLERWHTVENTYEGFAAPFERSPREAAADTEQYQIGVAVDDANSFTITATPQRQQADDRCGTLTMNQAGVKTPDSPPECW